MLCKWSLLLGFTAFLLAAAPCFADVVPISVSEQVNGMGFVDICDFNFRPGCLVITSSSFSFGDSNNQPGPFTTNKSGDANSGSIDASGQAQQTSNVTSDNINVQMSTQFQINGFNYRFGAMGSVNNDFALQFDLTSPATLHLTGSLSAFFPPLPYGAGTESISVLFTGPGIDFTASSPCAVPCSLEPQPFDQYFSLNPGIYNVSALADTAFTSGSILLGYEELDGFLSLQADFTAVPEPLWTPMVPAMLVLMSCCVFGHRRRRRSAR
jgi:hypothetical protein